MSSWSSSPVLCTGAWRPCGSSPWCGARLAYSETGSGPRGSGGRATAGRGGGGGIAARSAGRGIGRTGLTLPAGLSSSSVSRRPRPTAARRRSRPPRRFSGLSVSASFTALGAQFPLTRDRQFVDPGHPRPPGRTLGRGRNEGAGCRRVSGEAALAAPGTTRAWAASAGSSRPRSRSSAAPQRPPPPWPPARSPRSWPRTGCCSRPALRWRTAAAPRCAQPGRDVPPGHRRAASA